MEGSLSRLGVDAIDLYFSHWPDAETPHQETLAAYEKLLGAGKVKAIGASNLDAAQLSKALEVAKQKGLPSYQVLQPEYNLHDRASLDGALRELCVREGLGIVAYYSLASGFLTGKYRSEEDLGRSARGKGIAKYLTERGMRILAALDELCSRHATKPAEVALAWVMAQEGVTAPIASATSVAHVESFARATGLRLTGDDLAILDLASS